MKIPKKIKVLGHNWDVVFPYHFVERSDCLAVRDVHMKTILVSDMDMNGNRLPDSTILTALLHEMFHIIEDTSRFKVFEGLPNDLEEEAVQSFAEIATAILIDNRFIELE